MTSSKINIACHPYRVLDPLESMYQKISFYVLCKDQEPITLFCNERYSAAQEDGLEHALNQYRQEEHNNHKST